MRGSREISLVPSLHRASTDALIRDLPEEVCVLVQIEIEIEIVMAMTQRAYAQYVHIHGNKKIKTQGDKLVTIMKRACAELWRLSLRMRKLAHFSSKGSLDGDRWWRWERVRLCGRRYRCYWTIRQTFTISS